MHQNFEVFRSRDGAKVLKNIKKKRPASFENERTPKYLCDSSSTPILGLGGDSDHCVYSLHPGDVR